MFDNIGGKIKVLAKALFWIEVVITVVVGIVMIKDTKGISLLFILVGILAAWISALPLYGLGEIIDKLWSIEINIRNIERNTNKKSEEQVKVDCARIDKIEKLYG